MKERNTTIDFLRGLSVILIILIHVSAYFTNNSSANFLANYSQFAVQIFVFCSAFIYFEKKKDAPFSIEYILKRVKRLVIPYYIFVVFFFLYILFVKGQQLSFPFISKWLFLQGDRDLNWLVILFIYFIFLMPFIRLLREKKLLWIFSLLSLGSSIVLLFVNIPVHFRLIMWLPWSIVLIYSHFYSESKQKKLFLVLSILISLGIYALSQYIIQVQQHTLIFTQNKYPPNIFYLSYGILGISILTFIHQQIRLDKLPLQRFFDFASKYSYPIFFIHFLYLYIFLAITPYKTFQWWGLFFIISALTFMTMWVWSKKDIIFSRH